MSFLPRSARGQHNPYEEFRQRDLSLTDYLAIDRTILANERTVLAYARTALAMVIIGGTAIKFFAEWYMWAVGVVFLAGAAVVAVVGAHRYLRTARQLGTPLEGGRSEATPARGAPGAVQPAPEPKQPGATAAPQVSPRSEAAP